VDYGEDDDLVIGNFIQDAIIVSNDFAHGVVAEIKNLAPAFGKTGKAASHFYEATHNVTRVGGRIG
jgi:hypothetical protein